MSSGLAKTLVRRLDELGCVSDEPGRLTRTFLSPAMKRANALVAEWMHEAGLTTRIDSTGNLIGRLEGTRPRANTLLLGSHLDTVRDAGRFDGALGVLLPVSVLGELQRRNFRLPFAVEVLGFSDEEGIRFGSAYHGSAGYAGKLKSSALRLRDARGTSVLEALEAFNGGEFTLPRPAHRRSELIGYVEAHIEQGPVLEQRRRVLGVVSAIAGQSRLQMTWSGRAGHAGTTPMALRRDALAGAAEFIIGVERMAKGVPGLVATVGSLTVSPGAANVIPGGAVLMLDIRHQRDAARTTAVERAHELAARIAERRGLSCRWQCLQDHTAVKCEPKLTSLLARSVKAVRGACPPLVSGAGHDGVILSSLAPIAMLFVRCRGGLSHHPDEYVSPADLDAACRVMLDFLHRMADLHA